jgi:hypothetical protein
MLAADCRRGTVLGALGECLPACPGSTVALLPPGRPGEPCLRGSDGCVCLMWSPATSAPTSRCGTGARVSRHNECPSNGICRSLGFKFVAEQDVTFAGRILRTNHWIINPRADLA